MIQTWPVRILCLTLVAALPFVGSAQVRINEVCSSNNTLIADEDGDHRDWIELFNSGPTDINLAGYYLTDSKSDTSKWQIQSGSINANSYLLIFASDKDRPSGTELHTSFRLSQDGETLWLYDPFKNLIDSVRIPFVSTDLSYGSSPNGSQSRAFFRSPTPLSNNDSGNPTDHIIAFIPEFTVPAGIIKQAQVVSITSRDENADIHYTLNGAIPTSESPIYTEPILVDENSIITAVSYVSDLLPSKTASANYIFLAQQYIPVVCLSTHPGYFFDADTGIYEFGPNASPEFPYLGANFWSDTEIPVTVQWFDEYGKLGFEQLLGVQIHGGSVSRTRPMRSLRLLADDKYGKDEIEYPLFTTKPQPVNKRFILRNSGSDYLKTMLRDGMIHNLMISDRLHLDAVSYRPVEVFINGVFWGIHNVREKVDRYYLQYNFGVDDDNVDMLEEQVQVIEGNYIIFNTMESSLLSMDLSDNDNFHIADSLFDVLNMADYYIAQTYVNNLDWPYNNLKFWRERKVGAKWRYIMFDLDATLGGVTFAPVEFDNLERSLGTFGDDNRHIVLFRKFLENETYRNYFINRYCDLVNTTFHPTRFLEQLALQKALIEPVISKHYDRWGDSLTHWNSEIGIVEDYIMERPPFAVDQLQAFFNLSEQANIHLNVYPPKAGTIDLNSVSLRKFPFEGIYFEDVPIKVGASANPGFVFSHWETNQEAIQSSALENTFLPRDGDSLTAVFVGNSNYDPLRVFPNPAKENATVSFVLAEKGSVEIALIDLKGSGQRLLYQGNLFSGSHSINIELPAHLNGIHVITLLTPTACYTEKLMILNQD